MTVNLSGTEKHRAARSPSAPGRPRDGRESLRTSLKKNWQMYLLLCFPVLAVIVFCYLPLLGLSIAFLDYDPIGGFANAKFIGLSVFRQVFTSKDFYLVFRNTMILQFLNLVFSFPAPIILALMLNELRTMWFKKVSQTVMYLPHFLSWVVIASVFYQLLSPTSGTVNILLKGLGLHTIPFLTEPGHWLATYVAISVWQSMGWGTILYLSSIAGISEELYEAATVDGAGRWQKMRYVTLPSLRPTIVMLLILNLGRIMSISFEQPYTLGNPMVYSISNVISTYVYDVGLKALRYNVATAVGLFQSVVGFVLVLISDRAAKRLGDSGLI